MSSAINKYMDELVRPPTIHTCGMCGEGFSEEVWHCPVCSHHWPFTREDCWNCHEYARPMTAGEARESIARINEYGESLFAEVKKLYDRQGWVALDYATFRECAVAEFRFSKTRIYELLNAAEVSATLEKIPEFPEIPTKEGQLNELAKLRVEGSHEYDTELQKAVWKIASETAPVSDQGRKLITAQHIKSVAEVLTGVVKSGGLDDGSGEMKPIGILIDAAVTEETYERLMRQKEHIKTSQSVRRAEKIEIIKKELSLDASLGKFPVVYADPPWRYDFAETDNRAIENQYPTMEVDEICALPVAEICADDCILFMWATSPKLREALKVVEAWGFDYKTAMVWAKDKIGMGYYARQQHEFLLIAKKGELPAPSPENRPPSVVTAPRTKHSAKPEEFYEIIERMYPELPRVELFCRTPREGWEVWGNEV